jgi:hypothetical protein
MSGAVKEITQIIGRFFSGRSTRRFIYLIILVLFALVDFIQAGLVRRTFIFFTQEKGNMVVEERFFPRSGSQEVDIRQYMEDVLLGPATPDVAPLFPQETILESLMYRGNILYIGLSEAAALPPAGGENVFTNLHTLYSEIQRNFRYIKDVKLFIKGNEVFFQ